MKSWSAKTIVIDGIEIVCDPRDAVIDGSKLSTEMDRVSGQIAFWGSALSSAVRERDIADAQYRAWRARAYKAIMTEDPKLPEYKVKVLCEQHPSFLEHKLVMAKANENVVVCERFGEAFGKKANQLQTRGATKRAELSKGTIRTLAQPEGEDGDDDDDDDDGDDAATPVAPTAPTKRTVKIELLSSGKRKSKK